MTASICQRRALHLVADHRTAGQRRADAHQWMHPEHKPLASINAKPAKPVPAWITFALTAICLVAVTYAVGAFAAWVSSVVWSGK